jgi:hypothetical protein
MGNIIGKNKSIEKLSNELTILRARVNNTNPLYSKDFILGDLIKNRLTKRSKSEIFLRIGGSIANGTMNYIEGLVRTRVDYVTIYGNECNVLFIEHKMSVSDVETKLNAMFKKHKILITLREPSTMSNWILDPDRNLNEVFVFCYVFNVINN